MTRVSPAQVAFSSGEISPLLRQRFDYQRYQTGLAACRGFIPILQGGVTRAPGTVYRGQTRYHQRARLINFEFAANDSVVLEFTTGRMRVWRYGELITAPGSTVPYELNTPYATADLDRLQWVQSADVIWLVDGQRPIQRLARHALDDWEIGPADIRTGPFRLQNLDKAKKLQASAATGTITLTASSPIFAANHVGSLLKIDSESFTDIALWSGNSDAVNGDIVRYDGRIYRLVSGGLMGANPPQHLEGIERTDNENDIRWEYLSDYNGIVRITAVANATTATAQVIKTLPISVVTAATYRWSEGAWSARHGYPAAVELHDQRMVAAATPTDPRTVWFSVSGDFVDFEPGTDADSAFSYSISGGASINRILWLQSARDGLHIGALGEEYSSIQPDRSQPLSATNHAFRFGSSFGSRENVRPIAPDGLPIFVSKDKARLIEIAYSLDADANVGSVLSMPSDHLGQDGFSEVVWQGAPQRMAWLRTDTGDLVVMVYDRSEETLGWAPCSVAGGFVESMTVTRDATGSRDILTLAVRRQVEGQTRRYVEEVAITFGTLSGDQPISDAIHFFSALVFDGAAASSFQIPHLAGHEVYAWTNAGQFGPIEVPTSGTVSLPVPVSKAVIGLLDATHHVRTLPLVPPVNNGSSLHRRKRLSPPIGIGLHRSAAARAAVVEADFAQPEREWPLQNLIPRMVAADLTRAFSGVVRAPLTSGYADDLSIKIVPEGGAPLTITAIVPTISEAGI